MPNKKGESYMSRKKLNYSLVGSVYNMFSELPYQEETIIKLPNINLNTLEEIDLYTSRLSITEFYQTLPESLQNKNLFSIRVENSDTQTYYYIRTIMNNPQIYNILRSIKKQKVLLTNGYKTLSLVPICSLVNDCWEKIEQALKNRDEDTLGKYFSPNSSYYFKLIRHINSGYDFGMEEKMLEELKLEFRDYRIFRKAYIAQEKEKYKTYLSTNVKKVSKDTYFLPGNEYPYSDKEYRDHSTYLFNTQTDKEEFLEPEEYAECNPYYNDPGPQKKLTIKPKKKVVSSKDES